MALPDYPSLKRDISNYLILIMRDARDQRIEGDSSDYSTVDHEIHDMDMQNIGIEDNLNYSDLAHMTDTQVRATMVRYGTEFAAKMYQFFVSNISTALDAVGNAVDAGGQPLNAAMLLDMFEKVEMSFDDDGRPTVSMLCHPSQRAAIERIMNEDEEFKTGFVVIIERQKEAWLARQGNRKLVD